MTIYALGEDTPQIDDSAYAADSATIIGKVHPEQGRQRLAAGGAARRQR